MELRPHVLTAAQMSGIRRLIGTTRFLPVGPFQCSTSGHIYRDASPKAVSERTSYSQIRLAFHSLPQVIRARCTTHRFGPPLLFRKGSPCSWQAHLASGRMYATNALFTLGFPTARPRKGLTNAAYTHSPAHSSIGTRQRNTHCCGPPPPFVSTRFQFYFTPLSGFFSPFPHGTCSLSVIENM
jgi:hypothetical protein